MHRVDTTAPLIQRALALQAGIPQSFYDALIVAAALECKAEWLLSEDMQAGHLVDGRLRIRNPFED